MPGADTVAEYQKADLILLNGAGYAKWVRKVSLPAFRMVDTSAAFRERYIESGEISTHSHGPEGKHAHESLAFTTWLDLSLAAEQARAVKEALIRKRPEAKGDFDRNHTALERDLVEIHQALLKIVSGDHGRPLVVSHPVYDYLAHGYGLNIRSVHWEPDEEPSADQWTELRAILREHPAEWMIWEGEPLPGPVENLRKLGLENLVFDPCGNVPEEGDFLEVMRRNIRNLKRAF
jgi:zinc transport system substrate-binding protein